ncbi:sperm axonemal maintenance protein CFAP97D1 [Thunnus albacares]|uniref:sperm axonemal maintenance protein CFAP97D1 n=1 Tax=Thunnus albacares TaxID=8236 RepID=UPI001CF70718|nr:sperm axonemal maintenance protein CFAP97D1 [Thunnus albacares]
MMQHLAYQPLLPTVNKYLQQKWDQSSYDLHKRKVKSAKPTINTTPPKTYGHLALKLKKLKLEEEWMMKIQRENNMLMDKISHIMRTTGGVDNRNYYERKSLGKEKRQLELLRITKENQMILLRLSQCRPHYNVRRWHEDWLQTLKVMDAITRYPRGANQQKSQENSSKKSCGCEKEKKTSADETTHSPVNNKTRGKAKSKENKSRKETTKKENTGTEQEEATTHPAPKPNVPEKSISPDTLENPGFSDTIQVTLDKPPHTVETSLACDGPEMSNTPHTPKTNRQETTSTEEG